MSFCTRRERRKGKYTETHGQKEAEIGWSGLQNGEATAPWKLSVCIMCGWMGRCGYCIEPKEAGLGGSQQESRLRGSQQESSLCREAVFRQKAVVTHYQPWKWSTGRLGYPFEPDPGKALPPPQGWGIGVLDTAHPKSKTTPSLRTSFAPHDR